MELKLSKPLCFFDLETTGLNITTDRIIEIAILKVQPDGQEVVKSWLVNPEMPIPKESSDIHGITDDKVADKPTFKQIANEVSEFIKGSDLAGFNSNRFDIPVLAEEMLRVGQEFRVDNRAFVDIQNIFHKMEERTLSAGYKFYCNKSLENAHSAEADTIATYEILKAQLDRYPDLQNDVKELDNFSRRRRTVDLAGYIIYDEEDRKVFSFGKYRGEMVADVLEKDSRYFSWLLNADFPNYTKKVLTEIKLETTGMG